MPDPQQRKVRGVVDLVFLIDVTGSMQHCIDALKNNISKFIDYLTGTNANNQTPVKHWRGKVVGYRDWEVDGAAAFVNHPFVESAEELRAQLMSMTADGGGDEPESLLDALYKVANMDQMSKGETTFDPAKWRYRSDAARVIVAFTDASYKEPMREPAGARLEDLTHLFHSNRIVLTLFAPEMECHDRLGGIDRSEMRLIPYDKTSPTGPQEALVSFTENQSNFDRVLKQLAKSVSQSAAIPVA